MSDMTVSLALEREPLIARARLKLHCTLDTASSLLRFTRPLIVQHRSSTRLPRSMWLITEVSFTGLEVQIYIIAHTRQNLNEFLPHIHRQILRASVHYFLRKKTPLRSRKFTLLSC
ncbi:hypothetical protein PoB_003308300 [Plakobranchus ocellatus]|uniref:Uncharacterized protein n=1 Tax=Plakobranchus ocellatus TaxID=259542 RepID=A0AAV4AH40_9GAST|nr:hypothetical protein PoB_003308300 [Plakobranchus ocellatus]